MEIVKYLMDNYYNKYYGCPKDMIPDPILLFKALDLNKDRLIVIHKDNQIQGVAVFLTLSDTTFKVLEYLNLSDLETLTNLMREQGNNVHFILLTAKDAKTIRAGIKEVKKRKPKTISWFNPTMTKLHKYNLN